MAEDSQLTIVQHQVIDLLATNSTVAEIAVAVGVGERTIWRWKTEPHFQKAWDEVLATLWDTTKLVLKNAGGLAVMTLISVMEDGEATHRDKIAAANIILSNLHKIMTDDELRKRIEVLIGKMEE